MIAVAVNTRRRYNRAVSKKQKKEKTPNPYRALLPAVIALVAGIVGLTGMILRWAEAIPGHALAVATVGFGMTVFTLSGFIWTTIRVADDWKIVPRKFLYAVLLMVLPAIIHLIWVSQYIYVFREPDQGVLR